MDHGSKGYGRCVFDGDGNRYELWETKMLAHLHTKKLKKVVLGEAPNNAVNEGKNEAAFSEIVQYLDDRSLALVMRDAKDDGKRALQILRTHYAGDGTPRISSLYATLTSLQKSSSETVTDYVLRAENCASALQNAGQVISNELLIAMVMKGLPTNYKTFCVVMQQREQAQTFIEFKAALRSFEENERAANQHTGGGNSSKVMYHNNNNHNGGRGGGRQSDGKKPTCFTCKKEGHKFYDCPEKQSGQHSGQQNNGQRNRNTNTNRKWCSLCKNNSHTDKTCRKQNNNSERAKQVTFGEDVHVGHLRTMASDEHSFGFNFMCNVIDDSSTTTTDAAVCDDSEVSDHSFDFDYPRHAEDSDSIADGCKDVSHSLSQTDVAVHDHSFDFDYPRHAEDSDSSADGCKEVPIPPTDIAVEEKDSTVDECSVSQTDVAVEEIDVANVAGSDNSHTVAANAACTPLLVDSGCTSHIVNVDDFVSEDKTYIPENHTIELADGTKTRSDAKKKGSVLVNLTDEDGIVRETVLDNVLYCPKYPHNLFSVRSATEQDEDTSVLFSARRDELKMNDMTFPIRKEQGLYFLYRVSTAVSDVQSRSLNEWHKILGHCNVADIMKLEGLVDGMKISNKDNPHCSSCVLGKQTVNRSRKADLRAEQPMEFVHSDLSGPITPVAKDGYRYAMSFTDDYSSAIYIYFLRVKDDAVDALKQFLADCAPFGKVKRLRADNGGEYLSQEFKNVLIEREIKWESSAPYCPSQNGTAERGWRTLFEMARCMLIESEVPKYLWTYAIMAAVYIRNRCYSQRTGQTPFFLLTGHKPNLKKMKIFGTVCYGHIHEYKQKLDPRSEAGIFVGYEKNSAAYLVYYPKERRVKRQGMVTFSGYYPKELKKSSTQGSDIKEVNPNYVPDVTINNNNVPGSSISNYVPDVDFNHIVPGINNNVPGNHQINAPDVNNVPVITHNNMYVPGVTYNDNVPDESNNNYNNNDKSVNEQNSTRQPRLRRKPEYLKDYVCAHITDRGETDYCYMYKAAPKTYNEAVKSPNVDEWKSAMDEEMQSLLDNNTFDIVELPQGKSTVGGRWVYAVKEGPNGEDMYKARFVAKGFSQIYGIDYFSTFAPTARLSTIRLVIQIAVQCDYLIHQMDVKSAYLNAPIDCELFMEQPKGYETPRNGRKMVYQLRKSLYGLKQSAHNWREVICSFFSDHGCEQSKADPCLFMKNTDDGRLMYVIWVDDIIVVADSKQMMIYGKEILKQQYKMKDLGEISKFLGIKFKRHQDGSMSMDQNQYLESVLVRCGMESCNPRSTPCELKPSAYYDPDDHEVIDEPGYRAAVGSLVYAMTCTRPDLSWIVTRLSQHLSCPKSGDWEILKQALRYIKGTLHFELHFSKTDSSLKLEGYSDSDWAACEEDRRSTTGFCFALNRVGPTVSWKSRKQPTVALSTCEAEYMALCEATQEAIYLKQVIADMNVQVVVQPIQIYGDNQGSLSLTKHAGKHNRTKHIDVRYHFIRDYVNRNVIAVQHVPTDDNVADALTKPMPRNKAEKFSRSLFGWK